MTDGTSEANAEFRRNVGFYYDLVKANVERIVKGLAAELEHQPVTAVGVTPGWLRSERMLESFGVTDVDGSRPDCWGHLAAYGWDNDDGVGIDEFR
jgi:NAD(P)-dependent dehydrogenase (short-subunit alcohol dehydrogenase family)